MGTPESGQGRAAIAFSIEGGIVPTTVDAAGRGRRTGVSNRHKVAASRARRVGTPVLGSEVAEGAQGAHRGC